jgi:thiamine-phosphate pyrophosphorylase
MRRPGLAAAARRLRGVSGAHALPRLFLFSDPVRLPDPRSAARRLPPGAAVVARGLEPEVLSALAAVARRRRLAMLVSGDGRAALRHGAGLHVPDRRPVAGILPLLLARRCRHRRQHRCRRAAAARPPILTAAAHGWRGVARARRLGADAVVLSPVFPTASHPGAPALGLLRWAALARRAGRPVVALGGLHGGNARRLPAWVAALAAIGGFSEDGALAPPVATARSRLS